MNKNVCSHRAELIEKYVGDQYIHRAEFPARSLDLNPVWNIWDALVILACQHSLKRPGARNEEWGSLHQDNINNFANHMRILYDSCIAVIGIIAHTKPCTSAMLLLSCDIAAMSKSLVAKWINTHRQSLVSVQGDSNPPKTVIYLSLRSQNFHGAICPLYVL